MFDINSLAVKDSATLHLRSPLSDELLFADPDEKTKPVEIELYSTSSKAYRTAVNAMQNRQLKRGKKQASAEVMREEGVELLVACSIEGKNFEYKGAKIDNPDTFRALYNDSSLSWIKEQVDTFLGDISVFIQA